MTERGRTWNGWTTTDEAFADWLLVAAIAAIAWWVFPRMLGSENVLQTREHADNLDRRLREHEQQEDPRFKRIEEELSRRRR